MVCHVLHIVLVVACRMSHPVLLRILINPLSNVVRDNREELIAVLTTRPPALVAEWLGEQHKTCTEGARSPPAGHIPPAALPRPRTRQGANTCPG